MTVGLGFGLQEIFANFVSGIILLFERPARLDDTVTFGAITGMVTKIRIRALAYLNKAVHRSSIGFRLSNVFSFVYALW